ncbi:MAG TPA: dihydrodipicolinate reductase C-terminal domain-containing protein [Bauldia sp.]|nr:dihydrodipicolinate reductase C-terminal domain-containing protein [Bauldia sp.]
MTIRVVVAGATGWTGSALVEAISKADDLELAAGVARRGEGMMPTLEAALGAPSDVVVDYTHPSVVKAHALLALSKGRHVVVGTSGLTAADYSEIDAAARKAGRGVIAAGNFSITATLLTRFAVEAARYVPDVEVIDYASAKKPDVPSGTTQELAERIAAVRGKGSSVPVADVLGPKAARGAAIGEGTSVQLHSLRLPSYIIAVEAIFGAPDERLTIRHDAGSSAAPYVAGTLLAVRKVVETVGLTRGLDSLI